MMCNHDNTNNEAEAVTEAQPPTVAEFEALKNRIALRDADVANLRDRIHGLIDVIHNLPWEDINTGNFSPSEGCEDVAAVRDAFVRFGCDEEIMLVGLKREYEVVITVPLTVTVVVEAADDDDARDVADDHVRDEVYVNVSHVEDFDVEWSDCDITYVSPR